METWEIVTIAVAGGVAALITAFFSGLREIIMVWLRTVLQSMKKVTYLGRIERLSQFLHLFESIKSLKSVQRCILFQGHNCGGMPTVGKDYSVRALDGWTTKEGAKDPEEKFSFSLKVDSHYTKTLLTMMENGYIDQLTSDMPLDCKLRSYYESEGVRFTRKFYLGLVDYELLYLSVGSYDEDGFDRNTTVELQLIVDRLRSLVDSETTHK